MSKRKKIDRSRQVEEQIVDDLAFAATFATIPSCLIPPQENIATATATAQVAHNDSSRTDKLRGNDDGGSCCDETSASSSSDSDSDNESDVDLTNELMQMEDEDEDEHERIGSKNKKKNNNISSNSGAVTGTTNINTKPKTIDVIKSQNEVDLYNCPIEDLNKLDIIDVNINVSATPIDDTPSTDTDNATTNIDGQTQAGVNDTGVTATTKDEDDPMVGSNDDLKKQKQKQGLKESGDKNIITFAHSNNSYGIMNASIPTKNLMKAGFIKCHLVTERTIVVESDSNRNPIINNFSLSAMSRNNDLLDEGSLLLLKVCKTNNNDTNNKNDVDNPNEQEEWVKKLTSLSKVDDEVVVIPLGKILEVFGPISKPLYTVRLLLSPLPAAPKDQNQHIEDSSNDKGENKNEDQEQGERRSGTAVNNQEDQKSNAESEKKAPNEETTESPSIIAGERENTPTIIDPWSEGGILTKWLHANPKLEIYYATNQVKFVDTQSVVRNSRKGCDASNIYDEEVSDVKEMYFSDDEEERQAKQRSKKRHGGMNNNDEGSEQLMGMNRSSSSTVTANRRGRGGGPRMKNQRHYQKQHQWQQPSYNSQHPPPPPPPPQLHPPVWNQHQYYQQQQQQQPAQIPYMRSMPGPAQQYYPPPPTHAPQYANHMQQTQTQPAIPFNYMNPPQFPPPPLPQSQHQFNSTTTAPSYPTYPPPPPPPSSVSNNNQQPGYPSYNGYAQQNNGQNNNDTSNNDTVYYNYSGA
eukprot:CAMPEP_0203686082 /NCGR_PEP_ID=MMETSP0090-20130426/48879_1 /ASSEMBLY_ACC=CAM_ASM_001088 /TAXON_ID=426623 /ORGANISM="Chaetoceros affinis, Strain CCMP159" /LENGTH=747 /DNA_ID=CAMNT_0050555297 /DNA_START=98 /DNA_END=2341 /DNA_ORIENTATION=+